MAQLKGREAFFRLLFTLHCRDALTFHRCPGRQSSVRQDELR